MKKLVLSYTFDASLKSVTSNDFLNLESILLITNVVDNIVIYNFADPLKGGSLSGTTLTLDYNTTAMSDSDELQIFIEDGVLLAQESGGNLAALVAKDFATQTSLSTRLSESDFDTKIGSLIETAPATDTASSGINGRLQRIAQRISSLIALIPNALTGSGNFKVSIQEQSSALSIQDDGGSITVDGTVTANAGSGTFAVSASSLPLPSGASTEVTLLSRLSEADFDSKIGSLTETAPGTDTASSGLNGRLQRIAQRLTSVISLIPSALTGSGNFKVSIEEQAASFSVSDGGGSLTVDGTVTANAGTNLNTSALALESGGNLSTLVTSLNTAVTSLQIMDDWDESGRVKINPIVGQSGVAAGTGNSGATTQRFVLANNHGKTLKSGVVSLNASGNIVAAAGANKSIRVYSIFAQSRNDSMTLQITDGSGGGNLSARMGFNSREGLSRSVPPPAVLWKTSDNTALYASIAGTGTIDIDVQYWDDDPA